MLALILTTGAETPSSGTEIRCGRPGRVAGFLPAGEGDLGPIVEGGLVVLAGVGLDVGVGVAS